MARALAVVSKGTGPIKFRDGVAFDTGARFPSSIEWGWVLQIKFPCKHASANPPHPHPLALHRAKN